MTCKASFSIAIDSSSEILGARMILGTIEPSRISGIKEVPSNGSTIKASTKDATATPMVFFSFEMATLSKRR